MIAKIGDYFSGVYKELLKVTWPKREEVINHTLIVLVSIGIAMGIATALDYGLSKGIEYLISIR